MLKKLQIRFVLWVSLISAMVLIGVVTVASFANYTQSMKNADRIIDLIANNDFSFPANFKPKSNEFPTEIAHTARFFTVELDADGNITTINTNNIRPLPTEDVVSLIESALQSNHTTGRVSYFKYAFVDNTLVFLNIEEILRFFQIFMVFLILISCIAFLSLVILSILVSKRVVYPMVESTLKQKRFITDISHELKTPLAIIQSNNELLELDHADAECTQSINGQIARLSSLIESLISLSKLEENQNLLKTDFSVTDALSETVADFSAVFDSKNLLLTTEMHENLSYCGDEPSIRKLFAILLENATKYTPQNGEVGITLCKATRTVVFYNTCTDLPDGNYNHWFDRFYQNDVSRSTKGYGIGLSIVRAICENHKIKLSASVKKRVEIKLEF